MKKSPIEAATEEQNAEITTDGQLLENKGIDYFGDEAVPYHVAWIRKDLVAINALLNSIAHYAKLIFIALMAIAVILIFSRFR